MFNSAPPWIKRMFNVFKKCRHGMMLYNKNDIYIGRSFELYGEFSQGEIKVFEQFVLAGDTVVEVGANIGAHTLRLAQIVGPRGRVYAFEPQRIVFQTLCANMALNSITNVLCFEQGVASEAGELRGAPIEYGQAGNFGGVELVSIASSGEGFPAEFTEKVPIVTLDGVLSDVKRVRLLKIDVEGMELDVLKGGAELIRRTRPFLYLENDRPEKAQALVDYLRSLDYQLYWHYPPLYNPQNFQGNPENVFPGILSINVLGVPAECPAKIQGFPRVESAIHPVFLQGK